MGELSSEKEREIREIALEEMEKARPGWDVPHIKAAAFYMKMLIASEGGNPRVLLPAIYLHDIGYAGLLEEGYSLEENEDVKEKHMERGAKMCKYILRDVGGFTEEEIDRITHLVEVHDKKDEIESHEEQLVFEADSLAQIDVEKVEPSFNKENYRKFLKKFEEERAPKFKTETGKEEIEKLLPKAREYLS